MNRVVARLRSRLSYYRAVLQHPETPRLSRWMLAAALIYLVSPVDLIPDAIPVLGQLDDLLIVPTLVFLAMAIVPAAVKAACQRAATTTPPAP